MSSNTEVVLMRAEQLTPQEFARAYPERKQECDLPCATWAMAERGLMEHNLSLVETAAAQAYDHTQSSLNPASLESLRLQLLPPALPLFAARINRYAPNERAWKSFYRPVAGLLRKYTDNKGYAVPPAPGNEERAFSGHLAGLLLVRRSFPASYREMEPQYLFQRPRATHTQYQLKAGVKTAVTARHQPRATVVNQPNSNHPAVARLHTDTLMKKVICGDDRLRPLLFDETTARIEQHGRGDRTDTGVRNDVAFAMTVRMLLKQASGASYNHTESSYLEQLRQQAEAAVFRSLLPAPSKTATAAEYLKYHAD